jgi:cell division protein FtsB
MRFWVARLFIFGFYNLFHFSIAMKRNKILKILITNGLLVLLLGLQYQLWWGAGGVFEWRELRQQTLERQYEIAVLETRNATLTAEVNDLKYGLETIEERARLDFGLIKNNERFYQVIE